MGNTWRRLYSFGFGARGSGRMENQMERSDHRMETDKTGTVHGCMGLGLRDIACGPEYLTFYGVNRLL